MYAIRSYYEVERVVDGNHRPLAHQLLDQVVGLDPHALGQFTDGDHVADANDPLDRLGNGDFGLLERFGLPPPLAKLVTTLEVENFDPPPPARPGFTAARLGFAVIGTLALLVLLAPTRLFGS